MWLKPLLGTMATVGERLTATPRLGRRGLLGLGAALLAVGWGGTAFLTRNPTLAPADPALTALALWLGLFGLVAVAALAACPSRVTFSRPVLSWVGLNALGFLAVGAAVAGLVPLELQRYAFWHVWVAGAVVGFTATGELLRRAGGGWLVYHTAAAVELSLLVLGVVAFEALLPGLYLVLAAVHPVPLALDALDLDLGRAPTAGIQVALYLVALVAVLL